MSSAFGPASRLLQYLPSVYQELEPHASAKGEELIPAQAHTPEYPKPYAEGEERIPAEALEPEYRKPYLDDYLLPYEKILLGRDDEDRVRGLEEMIASLHRLFDPWVTPEEFLPWLAQWAALTLATGLPTKIHRKLLANIIRLYRIRGTKLYLEDLLAIYLRVSAEVIDDFPPLQVGRYSTVGRDSWIQGGPPHFFRVILRFSRAAGPELERQRRLAKYVIELAKPAHTDYALEISAPRFQVGVHSTVAMDSFL